MQGHVNRRDLRPPVRLSVVMLSCGLAFASALLLAIRHDDDAYAEASRTLLVRELADAQIHTATELLRVPMAIGDEDLVRLVADGLVERDPMLVALRVDLPDGTSIVSGESSSGSEAFVGHVLGPSADVEGMLLGAQTRAGPLRRVGQIEVHVALPAIVSTMPAPPRVVPWVVGLGIAGALGLLLWLRSRLRKLVELAAAVAQGSPTASTRMRGGDEIAWAARRVRGATRVVAKHVEEVEGRNADLLRDVVLKEDRLQRIAAVAATLVAPLQEQTLLRDVVGPLAEECGAGIALMFVTTTGSHALHCEAAHGLERIEHCEPGLVALGLDLEALPDSPTLLHALETDHPWMRDRKVPLSGVAALPLRFGGHLEGLVVFGRREPWTGTDLEFMADIAPPLAIALANLRAYEASVALTYALEQRNDELVRQRDRLEEVDRLRAQFVANISHELRTPLNAIIGYTELVVDECFGPVTEKQQSSLESVLEASHHLLHLVNQVLDLSRAEVGELALEVRECDVLRVARDTAALLQPLTRDRPYKIVVRGTEQRIQTDPERVHQILTNLLNNAIKFTNKGSVAVNVVPRPDGGVALHVEDTGIGIDPSHMELVFEEFRQVDGSTTRTHDGVGLGLAISRRLATALGGSLSVSSTLGRGSTFTLSLPAVVGARADLEPAQGALSRAS